MGQNGFKGLFDEWTPGDWKDKHCSYLFGHGVDAWSQCLCSWSVLRDATCIIHACLI